MSRPISGDVTLRATSLTKNPEIADFYRRTGYSASLEESDQVLVAESGGEIVGVLRLGQEEGVWVLRGMRVIENRRRQGLGSALLREAAGLLGQATCYCIPHAFLEAFYASAGFARIQVRAAPPFLLDRWHDYGRRGLDVIIMRRKGART